MTMWILFLLVLACCWLMVGLCGFVWWVHYPMLAWFPGQRFARVARQHQLRTGWVVTAPMFLELIASLALLGWPHFRTAAYAAVSLPLVLIWLKTMGSLVPIHRALALGYDRGLHRRLIQLHGVRTALWFARGLGLTILMAGHLKGA